MNKRISISATISLVVNFLLVILVCVAGIRIDSLKADLVDANYQEAHLESNVDYWQTSSDAYKELYELMERENIDRTERNTRLINTIIAQWDVEASLHSELEDAQKDYDNLLQNPVIIYVEKIVETYNPPRYFESEEELAAFLAEDKTDELPYIVDFFVCADFAEELHIRAEQAGYKLWPESWPKNVKYATGGSEDNPHSLCHTYINGIDYFIEPMTDDYWQQYGLTDISEAVWAD